MTESTNQEVTPSSSYTRRQAAGLLTGLFTLLFVLWAPAPEGMAEQAWITAGIVGLMAAWWISEATHITVTALVPLVLFPALNILSAQDVSTAYADHIVFLFFGAFFIAIAMEKWELHRRIALLILA